MPTDTQALVLGGGLSGCLIAADLADHGVRVAIVEQLPRLLSGASRWNDGKLHLGYTFTGSPSLATAALMQRGSAVFISVVERALGEKLPSEWFNSGAIYLVDAKSMVDGETLWRRAQRVADLHSERSEGDPGLRDYLEEQPTLERMDLERAQMETRQEGFVSAWRTPERHVSARAVADRLETAIHARDVDIIEARVTAADLGSTGWRISLADGRAIEAPVVVNCLWENRAAIDRQVHASLQPTSIRYKRALFGTAVTTLAGVSPSTRLLGPFGDIVTYRNNEAYLSWYPAGLAARSDDGVPPTVPELDRQHVIEATLTGLRLPAGVLAGVGSTWRIEGGFVVAWGHGDIDRHDSPLHERHRPGVHELRPGFISVDTGKYTLAPLLANRAVEMALKSVSLRS